VGKSVTEPGKCYAISDGDRQDDPRKKGKKGEKKRFNLLPPGKGEIGGLTFFSFFFQSWNKKAIPKRSPSGTKPTYDVLAKKRKEAKKKG
jgi:hypothetical protein